MTAGSITFLVIAICLVPIAGTFGAMDAALQRVSKARVEEMRRAQQAKERRRTLLIIGSAVLVIVVLIGLVTFTIRDFLQDNPNDLDAVGVAAAEADCDPVTDDPADGVSVHVGPGTESPDVTKVDVSSAYERSVLEAPRAGLPGPTLPDSTRARAPARVG